jgi:hypothetical protein
VFFFTSIVCVSFSATVHRQFVHAHLIVWHFASDLIMILYTSILRTCRADRVDSYLLP